MLRRHGFARTPKASSALLSRLALVSFLRRACIQYNLRHKYATSMPDRCRLRVSECIKAVRSCAEPLPLFRDLRSPATPVFRQLLHHSRYAHKRYKPSDAVTKLRSLGYCRQVTLTGPGILQRQAALTTDVSLETSRMSQPLSHRHKTLRQYTIRDCLYKNEPLSLEVQFRVSWTCLNRSTQSQS